MRTISTIIIHVVGKIGVNQVYQTILHQNPHVILRLRIATKDAMISQTYDFAVLGDGLFCGINLLSTGDIILIIVQAVNQM